MPVDNTIYKTKLRLNTKKQDQTIEEMHLFTHVLSLVLLAKANKKLNECNKKKKDSYKDLRSSGDHKLQLYNRLDRITSLKQV